MQCSVLQTTLSTLTANPGNFHTFFGTFIASINYWTQQASFFLLYFGETLFNTRHGPAGNFLYYVLRWPVELVNYNKYQHPFLFPVPRNLFPDSVYQSRCVVRTRKPKKEELAILRSYDHSAPAFIVEVSLYTFECALFPISRLVIIEILFWVEIKHLDEVYLAYTPVSLDNCLSAMFYFVEDYVIIYMPFCQARWEHTVKQYRGNKPWGEQNNGIFVMTASSITGNADRHIKKVTHSSSWLRSM